MDYTSSYLSALQQLLPRGIAWTREASAHLTDLFTVFAAELSIFKNSAMDLLPESSVKTTTQMIEEWEDAFGVAHSSDAIQTRRDRVNAKQNAQGGQSVNYFYRVLSSLGYNIYPSTTDPHIRIETGTGELGFRADISMADVDVVWDEDSGILLHTMVITGTSVESDTFLQALMATIGPAHVAITYVNG
jgi:uncharacterized protein YmfQ (DUF2313 family)